MGHYVFLMEFLVEAMTELKTVSHALFHVCNGSKWCCKNILKINTFCSRNYFFKFEYFSFNFGNRQIWRPVSQLRTIRLYVKEKKEKTVFIKLKIISNL